LHYSCHHLQLHAFPTRRSSDLVEIHVVLGACERVHPNVRKDRVDTGLPSVTSHRLEPTAVSVTIEGPSSVVLSSAQQIVQWIERDRKSTRLNSSHGSISYAVFC